MGGNKSCRACLHHGLRGFCPDEQRVKITSSNTTIGLSLPVQAHMAQHAIPCYHPGKGYIYTGNVCPYKGRHQILIGVTRLFSRIQGKCSKRSPKQTRLYAVYITYIIFTMLNAYIALYQLYTCTTQIKPMSDKKRGNLLSCF